MKCQLTYARRSVLALGAGAMASCLVRPSLAGVPPSVIVELFTSQGCTSCPPADNILSELRGMPGVIVMAYHVDYWDYLGWQDTLANPEFSQRQYDYAKFRGDMDVYTPQIIVNGAVHLVGSKKPEIIDAIAKASSSGLPVPLQMSQTAEEIAIEIGEGAAVNDGMLWLMPLQAEVSVNIERGENAGRTMIYNNVVRRIVPAGMWQGKRARFVLPKEAVLPTQCRSCVAVLQRGKAGPILGAATWSEARA